MITIYDEIYDDTNENNLWKQFMIPIYEWIWIMIDQVMIKKTKKKTLYVIRIPFIAFFAKLSPSSSRLSKPYSPFV